MPKIIEFCLYAFKCY